MSGSLKVYCRKAKMVWDFRTGKPIGESHFRMGMVLVGHEIRLEYQKRDIMMNLKYESINTFDKFKMPIPSKHLLYEKDKAPVVMMNVGALMLLPDGSKATVLESTCDIEGNVVYVVDKEVVFKERNDRQWYNEVVKWMKIEYPEITSFKDMEWYIQDKKSPHDLKYEKMIRDVEEEYDKRIAEISRAKEDADKEWERGMSATYERPFEKECRELEQIEREMTTGVTQLGVGDVAAISILGSLGVGVFMLFVKLVIGG